MHSEQPQQIIVTPTKSRGIVILLTVLFGPVGMFYSTIPGALIMIPVTIVLALISFGVSLIITWPICIIWAAIAANSYNKKLLEGQKQF